MLNRIMIKRKPSHRRGARNKHSSRPKKRRPTASDGVWIYGQHAGLAAIANPKRQIHQLFITRKFLESHGNELPIDDFEIVDRGEIDAILPADVVHQGIAVLAEPLPEMDISELLECVAGNKRAVLLILDQATDPRNIGAVLRSGAAFGCAGVIVHDRNAPAATGALAKAASGALEKIPMVRASNLRQALSALQGAGFWCVGLDGSADKMLGDAELGARLALVLGAEGKGLRRLTRESCDDLVKIPITEDMESLNLSNAAAITLYETTRSG